MCRVLVHDALFFKMESTKAKKELQLNTKNYQFSKVRKFLLVFYFKSIQISSQPLPLASLNSLI